MNDPGGTVTGRVALVTGAGRGIGRATALALADLGARVMAVSRTEDELAALAGEAGVEYFVASVATPEDCARVIAETRGRLGPIDILVNNAGVGSYLGVPIWEHERAVWCETLAVNLDAPFELSRLAARDMVERRWGRIVMVSSTAGEAAGPAMSAYCASKAGVLGLMRAIACDVAPHNVTCNAVLPGFVKTAMSQRKAEKEAQERGVTPEQVWNEWTAAYPAGRIVTADEVAAAIVFLASDAASGINGESITVALGSRW